MGYYNRIKFDAKQFIFRCQIPVCDVQIKFDIFIPIED